MHYAFNYTQYVRAKEITKDNFMLFKKCTDDKRSNISLRVSAKNGSLDRSKELVTPRESMSEENQYP